MISATDPSAPSTRRHDQRVPMAIPSRGAASADRPLAAGRSTRPVTGGAEGPVPSPRIDGGASEKPVGKPEPDRQAPIPPPDPAKGLGDGVLLSPQKHLARG